MKLEGFYFEFLDSMSVTMGDTYRSKEGKSTKAILSVKFNCNSQYVYLWETFKTKLANLTKELESLQSWYYNSAGYREILIEVYGENVEEDAEILIAALKESCVVCEQVREYMI